MRIYSNFLNRNLDLLAEKYCFFGGYTTLNGVFVTENYRPEILYLSILLAERKFEEI